MGRTGIGSGGGRGNRRLLWLRQLRCWHVVSFRRRRSALQRPRLHACCRHCAVLQHPAGAPVARGVRGLGGGGGGGRQAAGVQADALTDSASSCRAWLCSTLCTVLCRRPAAAFPARACAYACLVDGSCRARVAGPATALCSIHSLCARHEQLRIMATHLHSTAAALPSLAVHACCGRWPLLCARVAAPVAMLCVQPFPSLVAKAALPIRCLIQTWCQPRAPALLLCLVVAPCAAVPSFRFRCILNRCCVHCVCLGVPGPRALMRQ